LKVFCSQGLATSSRCAIRLLSERPSWSARSWRRWCKCQGRVAQTRCGVRRMTSDARTGASMGAEARLNEFIILLLQGGRGRGVSAPPAHPNLRPQIAALPLRLMRICCTASAGRPPLMPLPPRCGPDPLLFEPILLLSQAR